MHDSPKMIQIRIRLQKLLLHTLQLASFDPASVSIENLHDRCACLSHDLDPGHEHPRMFGGDGTVQPSDNLGGLEADRNPRFAQHHRGVSWI